jgi:spore maturation protein SpmB
MPDSEIAGAAILRIARCLHRALPKAFTSSWWLLKIMIPVSLGVSIAQHLGLLKLISDFLNPAFQNIGLPGESALVFMTSALLNIYACIAVIGTMTLDMREVTIVALMCLISHNMIVETAIQKKAGSSAVRIIILRLASSFTAAMFLNSVLPHSLSAVPGFFQELGRDQSPLEFLMNWARGSLLLITKVILIVSGLLFMQELFEEFNLLAYPVRFLTPCMRVMGLSEKTSFQWLVAYVIGLTYGSAVMFEEVGSGRLPREDADYLNQHLAVSHSQIEDTLLFLSIGVGAVWITLPRLALAVAVVWLYHLEIYLKRKFKH